MNRANLKDCTFTIPVRVDTDERRENLHLVLDYLDHHFDTNIIIIEESGVAQLRHLGDRFTFIHTPSDQEYFHRTRILNIAAHKATTKIIANYDTDVLIPPDQILGAVRKIRAGELHGCWPYGGMFINVNRELIPIIRSRMSIEFLGDDPREMDPMRAYMLNEFSFGGAIFWDKHAFISGGMENETFKSWGYEDNERVTRFGKLGFKLGRVPGPLFHLDHPRGVNSSESNSWIAINAKEQAAVDSMDEETLRTYVRNWGWTRNIS